MKSASRPQPKIIFDAAVVLMAVGLLALSMAARERAVPGSQAAPSVLLRFYIIYLGVLFLLSYFYSQASYVMGALMWTCEHFSHPRGRFMALFYSGLLLVVGVCALLAALGVL